MFHSFCRGFLGAKKLNTDGAGFEQIMSGVILSVYFVSLLILS